jgi:hypothetical protein
MKVWVNSVGQTYHDRFIDNPEIMAGILLGDGCITRQGKRNPTLNISQKQEDLVRYLQKNLCPSVPIYRKKKRSHILNGLVVLGSDYSVVRCNSYILNKYYRQWYPLGKKIVPPNLSLTPLTVLNWFMGDGSTYYTNASKGYFNSISLCLYTQGFSNQDVEFLNYLCEISIGFRFNYTKTKSGLYLRISQKDKIEKFLNYSGSCPVPSMAYKWKYPNNLELSDNLVENSCNIRQDEI